MNLTTPDHFRETYYSPLDRATFKVLDRNQVLPLLPYLISERRALIDSYGDLLVMKGRFVVAYQNLASSFLFNDVSLF
jgi:hypothetical protein